MGSCNRLRSYSRRGMDWYKFRVYVYVKVAVAYFLGSNNVAGEEGAAHGILDWYK